MRVTLAQIAPKLHRKNLEDVCKIVLEYKGKTDLIVFPELALNGYMLQDKLFEDAWALDELRVLQELSNDVDIAIGAAMREANRFRNSALYFSRGTLLSKHDKVHLPNYGMFEEARYFSAGSIFESFSALERKISMLVCEDLWHGSVHEDLLSENPDMILVLVASPARGFTENNLLIEAKWYEIIQKVAKECNAQLIFVNRVGFEDGLGFWGGSAVLDGAGNFLCKLPKYESSIQTFEI
ncbi:MAG: nitrilase-related carbon-nitrogen hydrolase [Sulfurimonadaceae bacterium]